MKLGKEAFLYYQKEFLMVLAIMLPVMIISLPVFVFLYNNIGIVVHQLNNWRDWLMLFFVSSGIGINVFFLWWSQVSFSQAIKAHDLIVDVGGLYRMGWRELKSSLQHIWQLRFQLQNQRLGLLQTLAGLLLGWVLINGGITFILQMAHVRNGFVSQIMYLLVNYLLLIPYMHFYLLVLFRNKIWK